MSGRLERWKRWSSPLRNSSQGRVEWLVKGCPIVDGCQRHQNDAREAKEDRENDPCCWDTEKGDGRGASGPSMVVLLPFPARASGEGDERNVDAREMMEFK